MALNKINEFHDLPEGKRLCILSAGPSLSALDLTPLCRRPVMGLNCSATLFPDTHDPCTMDARIFTEFPDMLKKPTICLALRNASSASR
jgi:hypothetical protein